MPTHGTGEVRPLPGLSFFGRFPTIDARSLAAFRVAIGSILLLDLAIRVGDLRAFYSDHGMMPIAAVSALNAGTGRWSIHLLGGSIAFEAALFALAAASAMAMLVGRRTRVATTVSWLLLTSLQNRTPLLGSGGDELLRLLLFWGMFLPLGQVWSLDAREGKESRRETSLDRIASGAVIAQVCLMYAFSGLLKLNSNWLGGDALAHVFAVSWFSRPAGRAMLAFPPIARLFTWASLTLELGAPLLLLSPWRSNLVRVAAIVILAAFHLAIAATMRVGWFPFVCIAALTLFVPSIVWDFFSTTPEVHEPADEGISERALAAACAVLAVFVLVYDLTTLPALSRVAPAIPGWFYRFADATALSQKWNMFDHPPREDVWYATYTEIGRHPVDILTGQPPDSRKPEWTSGDLPNQNWRHFFWRLNAPPDDMFRRPAAEYLCQRWNQTHGLAAQITMLRLIAYGERRAAEGDREPAYPYVRWMTTVGCGTDG